MDTNWILKIQDRIKGVPHNSGRSTRSSNSTLDDLVFLPAQLAVQPLDFYQKEIKTSITIGKLSKKPINLKIPIIIGGMSFGALSKEAKIALAKASTLAGTVANTGEGGMLEEERKYASNLIFQYSTGRFGATKESLKNSDAIEIKIGQGAKPGIGGMLSGKKVTLEISQIRNKKVGESIFSPAFHSDIKTIQDLAKKIDWLRKESGGVPIIIKLGAGQVEKDILFATKANPDIIALDGAEGGTGVSSSVALNNIGTPTLSALVRARKTLDKENAKQELWIGGGLNTGADFAKALALGADAVFVGFPLLIAMGCIYCRLCHLGNCPKGIATQDPELRKALNIEKASNDIASYLKTCAEEIKIITAAIGKSNSKDLSRSDLRSLTLLTNKITGIPLA